MEYVYFRTPTDTLRHSLLIVMRYSLDLIVVLAFAVGSVCSMKLQRLLLFFFSATVAAFFILSMIIMSRQQSRPTFALHNDDTKQVRIGQNNCQTDAWHLYKIYVLHASIEFISAKHEVTKAPGG